ncbi:MULTISPECIES: cell wall-binding protein [unclassified Clostridium]|uniref:cell wall-binding protein n=1 Tax=unclassified Clostridium TaxID=2614128 RepID=UPI0002983847|nr:MULTISPECIES: cell wall-binding protein [unclassified Clostridium]EKQ51788.1 MAG: putative cell wall binding protein [Clostridium sp. Maddingley MBC34-26]
MSKTLMGIAKGVTIIILTTAFVSVPAFASQEGWIQNTDGTWNYSHNGSFYKNTWLQLNRQNWYYFKDDGTMATGWIKDNIGNWYYLYSNGVMASNTTIDGYKLNVSGQWIDDSGKAVEESNKIDPVGTAPGHGTLAINYDNVQIFRDGATTEVWMWIPGGPWTLDASLSTVPKKEEGKSDDLLNGVASSITCTNYSYTFTAIAQKGHEYVIAVKWKPRYRGVTVEFYKDNYSLGKENELIFTKNI